MPLMIKFCNGYFKKDNKIKKIIFSVYFLLSLINLQGSFPFSIVIQCPIQKLILIFFHVEIYNLTSFDPLWIQLDKKSVMQLVFI